MDMKCVRFALPILALLMIAGCGSQSSGIVVAKLEPEETFEWCGQPVAFHPPPSPWSREGFGDGGLSGIWFVKKGGNGEAITVAEHRLIAERDQRIVLRKLLDELPQLAFTEVSREVGIARWRTDQPMGRSYEEAAVAGNEAIDRAFTAHFDHRPDDVRWELESALAIANHTRLTLTDVLDQIEFRPEKMQEPNIYKVTGRGTLTVAGEPAASVDYTVDTIGGLRFAREVYVMHDNHLFVARLIGLERDLPLFDQVVASLSFPAATSKVASNGP
jgi:hypothetical protein